MKEYDFNVEKVFETIREHWTDFMDMTIRSHKCVMGISGGKDSTVAAFLASAIFGKENVYGVTMPKDQVQDSDSNEVFTLTGINRIDIDIGDSFHSIVTGIENNGLDVTEDTRINLGPRLRMGTLYAVAQSVNGMVINTDNLCEIVTGYYTLFGDGAGGYGPLRDLTVDEVIALGRYLGIPENLITKKPGDGLQPLGDEERMGISYGELHDMIRLGMFTEKFRERVIKRYDSNRFKTEIVNIPHPSFGLPNFFEINY